MLRDEKIAPHIRLALAAYLVGVHPGLLDEETVQTFALASAQAWHDGQPITRYELEALLNAAAVLPMTETWQRTSALVLKRWNQREEIFRQAKRRTIERSYFPFILRFACRSGDEATLAAFLTTYDDYGLTLFNGILLENGDWKHAAPLKRRASSDESSYGEKWHWWLPPAEAALKPMLVEAGEEALLAEVMALTGDDTATRVLYPKAQWPEHDTRLAAFAKKLAATPLPAQALQRAQTLVTLGREHPGAALPLLPQFEAVSKLFLSDALGEDDAGYRLWADFLAVHAALKIAQNDFSQADASFKRLQNDAKIIRRYGSPASSIESRFRGTLFQCMAQFWAAGVAREPDKLLKLAVLVPPASNSSDYGQLSISSLRSCVEAWNAVLKQEPLPAKPASKPADVNNGVRLVEFLAAIAGAGKSRLSFQQRLQLLARISGQTALSSYNPKIWSLLVHHHIFTTDELVKNTAAIMPCASSLAPAHLEDYAMFMRQQNAFEPAVQVLENATPLFMEEFKKQAVLDATLRTFQSSTDPSVVASVSMFPTVTAQTMPSSQANRHLLERSTLLIRLKKIQEARDCLNRFNDADKSADNLRKRETLIKLLPPAPAPAK